MTGIDRDRDSILHWSFLFSSTDRATPSGWSRDGSSGAWYQRRLVGTINTVPRASTARLGLADARVNRLGSTCAFRGRGKDKRLHNSFVGRKLASVRNTILGRMRGRVFNQVIEWGITACDTERVKKLGTVEMSVRSCNLLAPSTRKNTNSFDFPRLVRLSSSFRKRKGRPTV